MDCKIEVDLAISDVYILIFYVLRSSVFQYLYIMHKFFHILLSIVTSTVVFGHAVVGHHHHEEDANHSHKGEHHHSHHHHHDGDDSGLKHLFEHHAHFVDTYTDNVQPGKTVTQMVPVSATTGESQNILFAEAPFVRQSIVTQYRGPSILKPKHLVHLDFRGPPQTAA